MIRSAKWPLAFLLVLVALVIPAMREDRADTSAADPEKKAFQVPSPAKASAGRESSKKAAKQPAAASPGLVALRKAVAAKNGIELHENIQKFGAGEFEEVWGLLLQCRDSEFITQMMQLAVSRGVRLGKLDEVLALVNRDIPPGTRRNSLLEWMFSGGTGIGENLANHIAKAESFGDPAEKAAAYQGISARLKNLNSLALIDPVAFVNGPPELLKALAGGVGNYPVARSSSMNEEDRDARIHEALAFAEGLVRSGSVGEEFRSSVIAEMGWNFAAKVWEILQETRPGLIQSDPEMSRTLLRAMSDQEPEKMLDLALQESWVEAGPMRNAINGWLYRDSAKAQAWYDSHVGNLTSEQQARMAAGFADFYIGRSDPERAREWIERIGDPAFRQSVLADHERMRGREVEVRVEIKP